MAVGFAAMVFGMVVCGHQKGGMGWDVGWGMLLVGVEMGWDGW